MRPTIRILDDEQLDLVLSEALRILSEVGVKVAGTPMRERLLDTGFTVADSTGRVRFPESAVRAAIGSAPSSFTLYDRGGEPYAELGDGPTLFAPGSSGLNVLDHRTGVHREATTNDFVEYVKVGHRLSSIRMLSTAFGPNDIEPLASDGWRLYLLLKHTTKPFISGAFSEFAVPRLVELLTLYRSDAADLTARPLAVCTVTAAGAFQYNEDSCQNLIDWVEAGVPVEIVPVTLMGLMAPVTALGAAAFHTAEVLAGLTMAQTVRPGAPTVFGGAPAAFHMQNTTSPMTAIEALRLASMSSLMGRYLGLPTQAYTSFGESKVLDLQAGSETAMGALLAVQSGMSSVSGPGMLDYLLTFSLPKLVMDDEIAAQALHFGRDIKLADDIPTTELINELLQEGHVVTADHTLDRWPAELHLPTPVWDRDAYDKWQSKGELDIVARATMEVERLLETYQAPEVDAVVDAEARAIIKASLKDGAELPA